MKAFGISDKGTVRSENQDRFVLRLDAERGLAILALCDGMGGALSGSLAAALASDAFMSQVERCLAESEPAENGVILRQGATYANSSVYSRASEDKECCGMGTTLVAVLLRGGSAALANVGDSRAYLFRDGALRQLTRDHSLVQEMIEQRLITPEEALTHPRRNIITRAIGTERRVKCDIFRPALRSGDRLLLCSDGLSNALAEEIIAASLVALPEPEDACRELLRLALEAQASDNVTAVVLSV